MKWFMASTYDASDADSPMAASARSSRSCTLIGVLPSRPYSITVVHFPSSLAQRVLCALVSRANCTAAT